MKAQHWLKDLYPSLPSLLQQAMNATNSCYQDVGETELMITVATRATQILKYGLQPDYSTIANEICHHGPLAEYSSTIGTFVKLYGGGQPFDLLHFVASFAPQHGKTIALGQDFWTSLTDVQYSQTDLKPMTRLAMLVTNLTAPEHEIVDNFSRLLTRQDVLSLKVSH